jgi:hypothetical protein
LATRRDRDVAQDARAVGHVGRILVERTLAEAELGGGRRRGAPACAATRRTYWRLQIKDELALLFGLEVELGVAAHGVGEEQRCRKEDGSRGRKKEWRRLGRGLELGFDGTGVGCL